MAVDENTIRVQLQADLHSIEPDIDVNKGPLRRLFVDPHARVVSRERSQIDRLIGIFTLQRLDSITTTEIDTQASAFSGMGRFQGRPSFGFATFFTNTRPSTAVKISIGDQVADATAALVYRVTQEVIVEPEDLIRFFNPITRRYEILAPIEAVSIGAEFDVPESRIVRIMSPIDNVTGVINNSPIAGGASVESNEDLDKRFRRRLEGQSLGSKGGLISELVNIPGVRDVALITLADLDLFSRRTERPAQDIYVLGNISETDKVSFTVISGKEFTLPQHRITSITSVTLDGEAVTDYIFVRDSSNLEGSVKETNKIEFREDPPKDSVVEVEFVFNSLLETVQNRATQFGDFAYFGVDTLIYEAVEVPLVVEYDFSFLSAFDKVSITNALKEETLKFLNPNAFVSVLQPESLVAVLQRTVPSATSIRLRRFTTKELSHADIEVVELQKNSYPTLSQVDLIINIRN